MSMLKSETVSADMDGTVSVEAGLTGREFQSRTADGKKEP